MTAKTAESVGNLGYHAHIYFDPEKTRDAAERVCAALAEKFTVELDAVRDGPVGPHPIAVPLRLHTLPHGRGGRLPTGVTP